MGIVLFGSFAWLDASGQLRGPKVSNETQLGRASRPKTIYVTDFSINPNDLAAGPVKSRLNSGIIRGTLDTIKGTDSTPEGQAQAIVNTMSNSIVSELQGKGFAAVRIRNSSQPSSGWIVRGKFSTVDQGDRAVAVKYALSGRALETNIRKTARSIADQIAKTASSL